MPTIKLTPKEVEQLKAGKDIFSKNRCKNKGCPNDRRKSSAYCHECSRLHKQVIDL